MAQLLEQQLEGLAHGQQRRRLRGANALACQPVEFGNEGVNSRYAYFTDNTLAQVVNRSLTTTIISQHDYSYDAYANRRQQISNIGGTALTHTYTFDALDRLLTVKQTVPLDATKDETYTYDPLNNLKTRAIGTPVTATTVNVHDAANQLLEARSGTVAGALLSGNVFDANGSLTKTCVGGTVTRTAIDCTATGGTVTSLTYDTLDRMTQAVAGATTETYAYDQAGKRIRKVSGATTTNFHYMGPDIYAEYGTTFTAQNAITTHGPNWDDPILRQTGTGPTAIAKFYHQDGLGSVVAVSTATGTTDGTQRFDAWGNKTTVTGAAVATYGYTGREPDASGLTYYRARYYDPASRRFTQKDPIGYNAGDINLYAYVGNNPVNYTDPTGEVAIIDNLIAGAANMIAGLGITALTDGKFSWQQAGIDFGVGAATNGVSLVGKATQISKIALAGVKGAIAGAGELWKGALSADGIEPKTWLNAGVAGVLNATGVIGKLSTAVGEKIPGINKLFYAPNPRIAALLQAPALAPGVTKLTEEMLGFPGNIAVGIMNDKLGINVFGSGKQNLGTFVLGDPGGAFGSDPFGMELRGVK